MAGAREQRISVVIRRRITSSGGAFYYSDTAAESDESEPAGTEVARKPLPRTGRLSLVSSSASRPRQDSNLGSTS